MKLSYRSLLKVKFRKTAATMKGLINFVCLEQTFAQSKEILQREASEEMNYRKLPILAGYAIKNLLSFDCKRSRMQIRQ